MMQRNMSLNKEEDDVMFGSDDEYDEDKEGAGVQVNTETVAQAVASTTNSVWVGLTGVLGIFMVAFIGVLAGLSIIIAIGALNVANALVYRVAGMAAGAVVGMTTSLCGFNKDIWQSALYGVEVGTNLGLVVGVMSSMLFGANRIFETIVVVTALTGVWTGIMGGVIGSTNGGVTRGIKGGSETNSQVKEVGERGEKGREGGGGVVVENDDDNNDLKTFVEESAANSIEDDVGIGVGDIVDDDVGKGLREVLMYEGVVDGDATQFLIKRSWTILLGLYMYIHAYTLHMHIPISVANTSTRFIHSIHTILEKKKWYAVRSMDAFAHALGWVMVMCMAALAVVFALSPGGMAAM
ncbi:hypothetical protein EON63_11325 [archaeon]|nr:MAG: hypothetical protein EON63_11325 [archaeon]